MQSATYTHKLTTGTTAVVAIAPCAGGFVAYRRRPGQFSALAERMAR